MGLFDGIRRLSNDRQLAICGIMKKMMELRGIILPERTGEETVGANPLIDLITRILELGNENDWEFLIKLLTEILPLLIQLFSAI